MRRSMRPHYAMAVNFAKLPDLLRRRKIVYDEKTGIADELVDSFYPSEIIFVLQNAETKSGVLKGAPCPGGTKSG
jgi:hypothetical protein